MRAKGISCVLQKCRFVKSLFCLARIRYLAVGNSRILGRLSGIHYTVRGIDIIVGGGLMIPLFMLIYISVSPGLTLFENVGIDCEVNSADLI